MPSISQPQAEHRYILALIIIATLICLGYSLLTPFNAAPDEVAHFDYINYLITDKQLPHPAAVKDTETLGNDLSQPRSYQLDQALHQGST